MTSQSQISSHKCPTNIQSLYIQCPLSKNLQTTFAAPAEWFEVINSSTYLLLKITPDEYIALREGEPPRYIRSFSTPRYPVKYREIGFTVSMPEDNLKLRYILEEIVSSSVDSSRMAHNAIQVIDYIRPDRSSYSYAIANQTNPYSIRQGMIEIEPGGGSCGEKSDRFSSGGLRFTFKQLNLVL